MKPILHICILLLIMGLHSCMPMRSLIRIYPDEKDLSRFKGAVIHAEDECFEFSRPENPISHPLKISDWTTDIPFFVSLDSFVKRNPTRSLLIIQNDTLKYEYYREDLNAQDHHSSYSIAKSFTSALIGIAIEEGYLGSVQDRVIQYIPELKGMQYADQLTIEHLLNHTSGIHYSLATDATIYYARNTLKALRKIRFDAPPGTRQHYLNVNIELLGLVLLRATNIHPAKYLEDKIWKPIQMCENGVWSIDEKNQLEKAFCCLGATALDYAKFGRLYLNKGKWNGKSVIPESWVNQSIRRDTANGSSFNYNYCWHIGLEEYGDYMAIGMYKQHIYINPQKNLIIVLFNDREKPLKAERVNWWFVFRQIADQL